MYFNSKRIRTKDDNGLYCYAWVPPTKLQLLYNKYIFMNIISPLLGLIYFNHKAIKDSDLKNLIDIEVDGIRMWDAWDFSDSYIAKAYWKQSLTALTESQIDQINDNYRDFVYEQTLNSIY